MVSPSETSSDEELIAAAIHGHHEFIKTASEYKWTLYNFSHFNEKNGIRISSPKFSNGLSTSNIKCINWQLELYPNGDKAINNGYISIYLRCLTDIYTNVSCEFNVVSNKKVYYYHKFDRSYRRKNSIAGCSKAIDRNTFLNDLINQNDELTVLLKFFYSKNKDQVNAQVNLVKDIALLLKNRERSDVALISSDGIQHKAHKLILSCRSKVFFAMFQHNTKECQENVVKIQDVDSKTLTVLLEFIYTGDVKYMQEKASEILIAADKYELHDLKKIFIIDIIENHMMENNVLDWIDLAYTYNIDELKIEAKKYFLRKRKLIMSSEGRKRIKLMSREVLEDLFCDISVCGE